MMRLAKWHAETREVVGEIRRVGVALRSSKQSIFTVDLDTRDHRWQHAEAH